jgi:serine protease inhibitor ecotin
MRILQLSILVLIASIAAATGASAAYPEKPIQLIVPYPLAHAGGLPNCCGLPLPPEESRSSPRNELTRLWLRKS